MIHRRGRRGSPASNARRGATVVEVAFVLPLALLLVLGLMVGCMGVFRSNQLAELARTAARYASTHGTIRELEGFAATTQKDIIDNAITPRAASLSPLNVQIDVLLPNGSAVPWDDVYWAGPPRRNKTMTVINDQGSARMNRVRVTLRYQWVPEAFITGSISLSSTSEQVMNY